MIAYSKLFSYDDKIRGRLWRNTLKEGMKPSRWYRDDPNDKGSLYLKRVTATKDIALDIIENSDDQRLIDDAKKFLVDVSVRLPKTFATWRIELLMEE
jgi:hypothetical protein